MFADIAGFTTMMQEDEALAMTCRNKLQEQLEKILQEYNGTLIEFRGDGTLCTFASTIGCVEAAITLQKIMRNSPVVPLRIGIHAGDVIVHENSIFGDSVNLASRLESFAVPGSIFISAKVRDDVKNQNNIRTTSLGLYEFKNVKEPMEIFCISNAGIVVPDATPLEGKGEKHHTKAHDKSIAVLPFLNLSNDPEQEYFSDGISEEILSSLSQLKELKVAGRSSSFQFRDKKIDLAEIGDKLHVENVLEGSVRKQGNRVRIAARLVSVKDGFHLWSGKFDRNLDDIFAIQDEIALSITEKLKLTLLHEDKKALFTAPTNNKLAYDLYLRGKFYWNKRGPGLLKGLQYFQEATSIDSNFCLAYSGIADTYALLAFYAVMPPNQAIPKALEAASKALSIDPTKVEPNSVMAFVTMFYHHNWPEASKQFKKVIELNPRYAPAHYWYSQFLCWIENNYTGAVQEAQFAIELEPLVSHSHHLLAFVQYNYGMFNEALEASKMAVELDENSFLAHSSLGMSYFGLNKFDEAIDALQKSVTLSARHHYPLTQLFYIYTKLGRAADAKKIADELTERSGHEYVSGVTLSLVAYTYGDMDKAFEYIERAFFERDTVLIWINISSMFSYFKTDLRFRPFLERLHLTG